MNKRKRKTKPLGFLLFSLFCMCSLGIYICTESPFDVSYLSILSNKTHPRIFVTHTMMITRGKDYIRTYQNYEYEKRFLSDNKTKSG